MNIKEYIKKQSIECKNEIMKEIFIDLVDIFYPKPKQEKSQTYPVNIPYKKVENTVYSRRVLVKLPSGKNMIGLIDEDGFDIKLPDNKMLEYQLLCHTSTGTFTYYTGFDRIFFKEKDSRIVKFIDSTNFKEHRSNIYWCFKYMSSEDVSKYKRLLGEYELDDWLDRYDRENKS